MPFSKKHPMAQQRVWNQCEGNAASSLCCVADMCCTLLSNELGQPKVHLQVLALRLQGLGGVPLLLPLIEVEVEGALAQ